MFRETNGSDGDNVSLLRRIDSLETLVMSNLPRVASLESWQRDMVTDMHGVLDWQNSKRREISGHHLRLQQIEKHVGMPPMVLETALSEPGRDAAPATATGNPFSIGSHRGPGGMPPRAQRAPVVKFSQGIDFDELEKAEQAVAATQTSASLTMPAPEPATSIVISADATAPLHAGAGGSTPPALQANAWWPPSKL